MLVSLQPMQQACSRWLLCRFHAECAAVCNRAPVRAELPDMILAKMRLCNQHRFFVVGRQKCCTCTLFSPARDCCYHGASSDNYCNGSEIQCICAPLLLCRTLRSCVVMKGLSKAYLLLCLVRPCQ